MSSRISKKKKASPEKQTEKEKTPGRSQPTSSVRGPQSGMLERFTKWRIITYVCVICLPPYGLYRIWSKESTFVLPEKEVWTFIVIVYMVQLFKLVVFL